MTRHNFYRIILTLIVFILVLSSVAWAQPGQVTQTLLPAAQVGPGLTLEVVGPSEVMVGETFTIKVMADDIPEPGMFGYQFVFNWESDVFTAVSVTPNETDFPVMARNELGASTLEVARSRQGAVEDVTGPVELLAVDVTADVVTDPDAATFSLTEVKVGRKGGIEVPVETVIDLDVIVKESITNGDTVQGNVKVEGRAADNQAGHTVTLDSLSTTTESDGSFAFDEIMPGTYTATADRPGFLKAVCEDVNHAGTAPTVLLDTVLLAGDIDGDMLIDITDATAIGTVFGSSNPDEVANLNVDGGVDVLDLILMAVNYGQTSEANPWVCQSASS